MLIINNRVRGILCFWFVVVLYNSCKTDQPGIQASLEDVGVSVGTKTCRERLLELLNKHITPKRPRLSRQKGRIQSKNDLQLGKRRNRVPVLRTLEPATKEEVNFSIYNDSQLIEMLQDIGLNTRGLDKKALIKSCRTYSNLRLLLVSSLLISGQMCLWEYEG